MIQNEKGVGYWLGLIFKIVLAVAMIAYLGKHSLNFFMWTFQGEDQIYAWLGLFTTSIGVIIWLLAYKFVAKNTFERSIALGMMFIALLGEFAVAGFDMYMNISGQIANVSWTQDDLRSMSYIVAGLALINGLALIADIAGMDIYNDFTNRGKHSPASPPEQYSGAAYKSNGHDRNLSEEALLQKDEPASAQSPFQG